MLTFAQFCFPNIGDPPEPLFYQPDAKVAQLPRRSFQSMTDWSEQCLHDALTKF